MRTLSTNGRFLWLTLHAVAQQTIRADDERIRICGTKYVTHAENGLRFQRHREEILQLPKKKLGFNQTTARDTTGIVIAFQTDSAKIEARFGVLSSIFMGTNFGVFENGELIQEAGFNRDATEAVFTVESRAPGASLFEIALPAFANVEFQGLEIDDGATLENVPNLGKRVYVALGDSLSHGIGQEGKSHRTWPFLLARKLDAELFTLAVGGGKISVPTGEMLSDWETIGLITLLVGYNDMHFNGITPDVYREKYNKMLDAIRANHPETRIYCISHPYTKNETNKKTGITLDQFRQTLADLVDERRATDTNLFYIAGKSISSEKNLRANKPKDPAHFCIEGAALFADELFPIIGK